MARYLAFLWCFLSILALLSVHVPHTPSSLVSGRAASPLDLDTSFGQRQARYEQYLADGGNDAVHKAWSRLRDLEPQWKEAYSTSGSTGLMGSAWYYTKALLRVLFVNAPSTTPTSAKATYTLRPGLRKAVDDLEASAAYDDPDAIYLLAEMSLHGNFTHPRDPQRALHWYSQLASLNGNSTAQSMAGLLYATGIGGVETNQAKAMLYHQFAADNGNTRSEMTLAFRYHSGIGTPRSCDDAVKYYKRVADKAMAFWEAGPPGGAQLPRNAYRWAEVTGGVYGEGASHSSSGPNARRGDAHDHKNFENILEYYMMNEASGDISATFMLGKHYYDPPRGYKRNLRAARRQFAKVAGMYWGKDGKINAKAPENTEKWAGKAAAYIGRMFLRGEGMEQNFESAITWFDRGISNGDPYAQYHKGLMYRDGLGVPQDGARAGNFLKASAEQGFALAQSALGVMFLDQDDVETAARYFQLAASAGIMEAFYYLAEITHLGMGRQRDCGLATVYYKVVAERAENVHSAFLEANNAYERGDYERAFIPMLMAAEQGYESAQANVAHLLDQSTSYLSLGTIPFVSQPPKSTGSRLLNNVGLALVYFTRSAKQANIDSLVKMGDYYSSDLPAIAASQAQNAPAAAFPSPIASGFPDHEKAVTCYTTAADGHHSAQAYWNLGWLHENGFGSVKQDFHLAKRNYDMAYELNKDEAYLPVKLALIKLRVRSWWNGVSGGKVNPIRDEAEENEENSKRPKTFWEWLNRFLDNYEEMDAAEAQRAAAHGGGENDMDWLTEPGMPGGDADYAAGRPTAGNNGGFDAGGDDWEDFDDGLVESLIIIALAGALALLVYARQQQQQGRNNANANEAAQPQQQPPAPPPAAPVGNAVPPQQGQAQAQQDDNNRDPAQGGDRGMFPPPGDPNFNNWVAGGIGH
ncbi:uncharacterized protein AB675_3659 [Cyphellophora attinorum]|uniref:Protein sel-1-like protein n=1 Tax=Cyphellophora attinorum TaxID=1664694 RepID=A0A0N1NWN5_9EURO|nr:uncharacterized protein AB675_3659 [Phialophora attinorum]KPI37094.1 hypothetical protein AB675_3659 [Phialophora attinorum]